MKRRRKHSYDLNLTPYIDLMSVLIVFLLMTAVWNHLTALSTQTVISESEASTTKDTVSLAMNVLSDRIVLTENTRDIIIPHQLGLIDQKALLTALHQWKVKYPHKTDVVLKSHNAIPYKMLIEAFDLLLGAQFPDVGISTQ